jgi:hypothetical protein
MKGSKHQKCYAVWTLPVLFISHEHTLYKNKLKINILSNLSFSRQ